MDQLKHQQGFTDYMIQKYVSVTIEKSSVKKLSER